MTYRKKSSSYTHSIIIVLSLIMFLGHSQNIFHSRSHLNQKSQHLQQPHNYQINHQLQGSFSIQQNHKTLIEMGIIWTMIISIAGGLICFALVYYFFKWRSQNSQQTYVHQPNNQYGQQYNTMPNNPNYNQWQSPYPQNNQQPPGYY